MRKEWRYSQVVRQGSAKPLCPGSNPGGASSETGCKFSYSPLFYQKALIFDTVFYQKAHIFDTVL